MLERLEGSSRKHCFPQADALSKDVAKELTKGQMKEKAKVCYVEGSTTLATVPVK